LNGNGSGILDNITYVKGDVDYNTGEVMYIDNRAAIQRSADQTEDIKIIIQL
jgi:hypothetical protein